MPAAIAEQQECRAADAEQADDEHEHRDPADRDRVGGPDVGAAGQERATRGADELVASDPATPRTRRHFAPYTDTSRPCCRRSAADPVIAAHEQRNERFGEPLLVPLR